MSASPDAKPAARQPSDAAIFSNAASATALSSAISTFSPSMAMPWSAWGGSAFASVSVNQNVLPCPGALLNPISPPISRTRRWQIDSPRPVPP